MKFAGMGAPRYVRDIQCTDTAAGDDDDAAAGRIKEFRERVKAFWRSCRAPRCQNPGCACVDDIFKGLLQISADVESTMKCYRERSSKVDELPRSLDVYMPISLQYA
jgi:hypothetical protein